jgi:hypothetical protein
MTYTKEELVEFTKKELIDILKLEGETHINKKRITKCNKPTLVDFVFSTYCIETKPITEESIEITAEDKPEEGKTYAIFETDDKPSLAQGNTWEESEVKEEPVVATESDTTVDVKELLKKAKEEGKKPKATRKSVWIERIESLLAREDLKSDNDTWIIPMLDLQDILKLEGKDGKVPSAYRYSCDWKVTSSMPAGKALAKMGYKAKLSLAKDKEKLTIVKLSDDEWKAILVKYNMQPYLFNG